MKISRIKLIEMIRESSEEMRSQEAIAHAQKTLRKDGLSFEDFITTLLDYLEDQTNQQWSEEMLPEDWNFYDEWIEGADPLSVGAEYIQDSVEYYMESKMKVTKRQLKRIVKEEKAKLQEVEFHGSPVSAAIEDLIAALGQLDRMDRSMTIYDLIDQLERYAETDNPPIF